MLFAKGQHHRAGRRILGGNRKAQEKPRRPENASPLCSLLVWSAFLQANHTGSDQWVAWEATYFYELVTAGGELPHEFSEKLKGDA